MSTFIVKQDDYHRRLRMTLTDISTSGATSVRFRMRPQDGGALTVDRNGVIDSASQISIQFQSPELSTVGTYELEASLVYADGQETVPTSSYVTVVIRPRLG